MRVLVGTVLPLFVLAIAVATFGFRPVTRSRLARFALRQRLVVTPRSAPAVARYLATTRRWRASSVLLAVVLYAEWRFITGRDLAVNLVVVFVGWFVGAVAAEWRIAAPSAGATRAAGLTRRSLGDYLHRREVVPPAVVLLGVGLAELGCVVVRLGDDSSAAVRVAAEFMALAVTTGLLVLAGRRVLNRPQPLSEPDVLDADDALRSRSLHVLAGCTLAIAGYFGAALVSTIAAPANDGVVQIAGAFGVLFLPIAGAITALGPRESSRRRSPSQVAEAVEADA